MISRGSANACRCWPILSRAASISCPNSSRIGGIRPLMKMLLDAGLLHGDCLTVTGQTMAENLQDVQPLSGGPDDHSPARSTRSRRTATW